MAAQGLALLVTDTSLQILATVSTTDTHTHSHTHTLTHSYTLTSSQKELVELPDIFTVDRHHSLLYVEVGHMTIT